PSPRPPRRPPARAPIPGTARPPAPGGRTPATGRGTATGRRSPRGRRAARRSPRNAPAYPRAWRRWRASSTLAPAAVEPEQLARGLDQRLVGFLSRPAQAHGRLVQQLLEQRTGDVLHDGLRVGAVAEAPPGLREHFLAQRVAVVPQRRDHRCDGAAALDLEV